MEKHLVSQIPKELNFFSSLPRHLQSSFLKAFLRNRLELKLINDSKLPALDKPGAIWFIGDVGNSTSAAALGYAIRMALTKKSKLSYVHFENVATTPNNRNGGSQKGYKSEKALLHELEVNKERLATTDTSHSIQSATEEAKNLIINQCAAWNKCFSILDGVKGVDFKRFAQHVEHGNANIIFSERPRKMSFIKLFEKAKDSYLVVSDEAKSIFDLGSRKHFDYLESNERMANEHRNILGLTSLVIEQRRCFCNDAQEPIYLTRTHDLSEDGLRRALDDGLPLREYFLIVASRSKPWVEIALDHIETRSFSNSDRSHILASAVRADQESSRLFQSMADRVFAKCRNEDGIALKHIESDVDLTEYNGVQLSAEVIKARDSHYAAFSQREKATPDLSVACDMDFEPSYS